MSLIISQVKRSRDPASRRSGVVWSTFWLYQHSEITHKISIFHHSGFDTILSLLNLLFSSRCNTERWLSVWSFAGANSLYNNSLCLIECLYRDVAGYYHTRNCNKECDDLHCKEDSRPTLFLPIVTLNQGSSLLLTHVRIYKRVKSRINPIII